MNIPLLFETEKLSGGLFEQVRKLVSLMVPVTVHVIMGSEDIIDAMDLRAFGFGPRIDFKNSIIGAAI